MEPNECKHCGCSEIATATDSEIVFRCWSSYVVEDDYWTVSNNCGARCAVQLVELRERVTRAVEVLEKANQIMMTLDDDEEVSFVVESQTVSHAIEILEGEEDDESG